VHTLYRWSYIPAGLAPFQKIREVCLKVFCVRFRRLTVDTNGPVFTRAPEGFSQPIHVDVMIQRCECLPRQSIRQRGYPLLSR